MTAPSRIVVAYSADFEQIAGPACSAGIASDREVLFELTKVTPDGNQVLDPKCPKHGCPLVPVPELDTEASMGRYFICPKDLMPVIDDPDKPHEKRVSSILQPFPHMCAVNVGAFNAMQYFRVATEKRPTQGLYVYSRCASHDKFNDSPILAAFATAKLMAPPALRNAYEKMKEWGPCDTWADEVKNSRYDRIKSMLDNLQASVLASKEANQRTNTVQESNTPGKRKWQGFKRAPTLNQNDKMLLYHGIGMTCDIGKTKGATFGRHYMTCNIPQCPRFYTSCSMIGDNEDRIYPPVATQGTARALLDLNDQEILKNLLPLELVDHYNHWSNLCVGEAEALNELKKRARVPGLAGRISAATDVVPNRADLETLFEF